MYGSSRRFALLIFAAIAALLVGCGGSPGGTPSRSSSQPTTLIPAKSIGLAPETARTPEGAKGGDLTIYRNGPWPLGAIHSGSAIHIDEYGLTLIENFEEVQKATYCPYWDAYGRVYTRGFGETDWSGNFGGRCISHAQAVTNLRVFVETKYQYAVRNLGVPLTQHQVDALDSFVWNLGAGIFNGTSVGSDLRGRRYYAASVAMLSYDRAGGVVLGGLVTRRHAEFRVFNTPDAPSETPAQHAAKLKRQRTAQLHADYRKRKALSRNLARSHCLHGYHGFSRSHRHFCTVERQHHGKVNRDITRLRKLGIR
jgi:lysozyme